MQFVGGRVGSVRVFEYIRSKLLMIAPQALGAARISQSLAGHDPPTVLLGLLHSLIQWPARRSRPRPGDDAALQVEVRARVLFLFFDSYRRTQLLRPAPPPHPSTLYSSEVYRLSEIQRSVKPPRKLWGFDSLPAHFDTQREHLGFSGVDPMKNLSVARRCLQLPFGGAAGIAARPRCWYA